MCGYQICDETVVSSRTVIRGNEVFHLGREEAWRKHQIARRRPDREHDTAASRDGSLGEPNERGNAGASAHHQKIADLRTKTKAAAQWTEAVELLTGDARGQPGRPGTHGADH
jgi:hypothetical protein